MRKSEKTTFQWPKVSKSLTTLPRHRAYIRTGLRFQFRAPEVPVLRVRNSHFHCFSSRLSLNFSFLWRHSFCQACPNLHLGSQLSWWSPQGPCLMLIGLYCICIRNKQKTLLYKGRHFQFTNTKLRHASIKPTQSGGIWFQGNGETEHVRSLEPFPLVYWICLC